MFNSFAEDPELDYWERKEIDQNITILQKQMKMYNIITRQKTAAVPSRLSKGTDER